MMTRERTGMYVIGRVSPPLPGIKADRIGAPVTTRSIITMASTVVHHGPAVHALDAPVERLELVVGVEVGVVVVGVPVVEEPVVVVVLLVVVHHRLRIGVGVGGWLRGRGRARRRCRCPVSWRGDRG